MADGVNAGDRLWEGICLATTKRCLFWHIIQLLDQTSVVIAEGLAVAVRKLNNRGFTCCGIVTNSASNEKRAWMQGLQSRSSNWQEHVSFESPA
jgi:hypothetical protein